MKKVLLAITLLILPISVCALEYPKLDSKNVEIYDLTDKKIIYEYKSNEVSSIASLTKIATTITAIENIENLNEKVTITEEILQTVSWDASRAGLKAGDIVTYKDLLYASMLPSGADATNSIAILSSGSIENFVKKMNDLVHKIGLFNTNFVNVTGLDEESNKSSADDVTKLLVYSLKNPIFKKLYTTKEYKMSNNQIIKSTIITNYNNPNYSTVKIIGNKTGYTKDAGYCLSSLTNINGHEVIIVLLNASKQDNNYYHVIDTIKLINFLEKNYKERILVKKNESVKSIKVKLSNIDKYNIKASSNITKYLPSDYNKNLLKIKYDGDNSLTFLSRKGRNLGTVKYYYDGKLLYKEDAILKQNIKINVIKVTKSYWYIILLISIIVIYNLSKKKKVERGLYEKTKNRNIYR